MFLGGWALMKVTPFGERSPGMLALVLVTAAAATWI
jgi:hypothetical protein